MPTKIPRESTTKTGSIAVYQRILPDRRPTKVEVIRSVRESYRSPDGKAFGRTNNTVLLRVPSGVDCLTVEEVATLRECGLGEREVAYVNRRLSELGGPSRERALEMDVADVKTKLEWIVALAEASPMTYKQVLDLMYATVSRLATNDGTCTSQHQPELVTSHESLMDALAALNRACQQAQSLYKRLPKGELPDDVVLEFQKSWFAYQDMLGTLKARKSMARPARWSNLRAQICEGLIYRKGQHIPE
jgi:hypothetical protein